MIYQADAFLVLEENWNENYKSVIRDYKNEMEELECFTVTAS